MATAGAGCSSGWDKSYASRYDGGSRGYGSPSKGAVVSTLAAPEVDEYVLACRVRTIEITLGAFDFFSPFRKSESVLVTTAELFSRALPDLARALYLRKGEMRLGLLPDEYPFAAKVEFDRNKIYVKLSADCSSTDEYVLMAFRVHLIVNETTLALDRAFDDLRRRARSLGIATFVRLWEAREFESMQVANGRIDAIVGTKNPLLSEEERRGFKAVSERWLPFLGKSVNQSFILQVITGHTSVAEATYFVAVKDKRCILPSDYPWVLGNLFPGVTEEEMQVFLSVLHRLVFMHSAAGAQQGEGAEEGGTGEERDLEQIKRVENALHGWVNYAEATEEERKAALVKLFWMDLFRDEEALSRFLDEVQRGASPKKKIALWASEKGLSTSSRSTVVPDGLPSAAGV